MALLAILAVLLIGNLNTTLKRGRDQQRKNDLASLQKALELYYEDNKSYPIFTDIFNKRLCALDDCTNGTTYMMKTPKDPSSLYVYMYTPEPTPAGGGASSYYYLYSYIENSLDQGSGVGQKGFTKHTSCTAGISVSDSCKYYVGSPNAIPLTPNP